MSETRHMVVDLISSDGG